MQREAKIARESKETKIEIAINLDGSGTYEGNTGIGFLDHMLCLFAKHGLIDLYVKAEGDLNVDSHHTIEDVGIVLGNCIKDAMKGKEGIKRYGTSFVPMDETLAHVVLDFSGRAHLAFEPEKLGVMGDIRGYTIYHLREFLRGFCNHAGVTLHVRLLAGLEIHHVVEAITKAFARALYLSTRVTSEALPSTKGLL